ncbi:MAG: hypothetical protein KAI28_11310, partial [Sphingomonadales bacterium]|nr:hypothetical protein [Sphingomonadales bacterium]
ALIGTMFGIAIVWLGAHAMFDLFTNPVIGLVALGVMVYALIGGNKLPYRVPGAVVAIVLSTLVYYVFGATGLLTAIGSDFAVPSPEYAGISLPSFTLSGMDELFGLSLNYMAITAPFALLIAASSINISTAAKLVGDDYDPRQVIWADSVATIASAFFGNVVQTTPYFGHTTYKRMGGRVGYSLGVVAVLVVGGFLGVVSMLIDLIPAAAIKPILIVVACDIVRLAFQSVPERHAPAAAFAIIPAILTYAFFWASKMVNGIADGLSKLHPGMDVKTMASVDAFQFKLQSLISAQLWNEYLLLGALSRGYILTGLLWATFVAFLIDRKGNNAAITLLVAAIFTLYGIIHSVSPDGSLYMPWELFSGAVLGMS